MDCRIRGTGTGVVINELNDFRDLSGKASNEEKTNHELAKAIVFRLGYDRCATEAEVARQRGLSFLPLVLEDQNFRPCRHSHCIGT